MAVGLDENGFTRKRLPETLRDIVEEQRQDIDNNISNTEDTLLGQINTIFGKKIDELWELAQAVNDNFIRRRAEGNALDDLGDLVGVYRLQASPSKGMLYLETREATTIIARTGFVDPITGTKVVSSNTRTLSSANCGAAMLTVGRVVGGATYTVTINGVPCSYTAQFEDNETDIILGIENSAVANGVTQNVQVNLAFDPEDISVPALLVASPTFQSGGTVSVERDAYFIVVRVMGTVAAQTETTGAISVPPQTITEPEIPNSQILEVVNLNAFTLGRLRETDEEFRSRFSLSTEDGKATVNAIQASLLGVDGVVQVGVYQNDTMFPDNEDRPPKSVEAVVVGGDVNDIGQRLFDTVAAGIETFGNTTVVVTANDGQEFDVSFSTPEEVYFAVRVTYSLYDEETFPINGETLISQAIVDFFAQLSVDNDVIPTRIYGPVYAAVDGIDELFIEIQEIETPNTPPNPTIWSDQRSPIAYKEIAVTTPEDIYFVT